MVLARGNFISMQTLDELFNKYGSDKGSVHGSKHGYAYYYEKLLSDLRDKPIHLLEIGLCKGGPELNEMEKGLNRTDVSIPSIQAWQDFFPKAQIYGFDISDFSEYESDRFRFFRGDSGIKSDFDQVLQLDQDLDVILDDGSHASFHQQLAFLELFEKLKSGGIYIIEDLYWQPHEYEIALPVRPSTLDLFSHFSKYGNFELVGRRSLKEKLRRFLHAIRLRRDRSLLNYSNPAIEANWLSQERWTKIAPQIESIVLSSKLQRSKFVAIYKK